MDSVACVDNREVSLSATVAKQEPQFRAEKVLDIKRQLAEGRYDIAGKLDVVVDRLFEELL
jgi:anti-sigma28 factor (negative regulator of flagellin synthesis)